MSKIYITKQIADGNLGEGWTDNFAVARALAHYARQVWTKDLSGFSGHDIEIEIDVQKNASGYTRPLTVVSYDDEIDEDAVLREMTPEHLIWEQFLESDAAKKLEADA